MAQATVAALAIAAAFLVLSYLLRSRQGARSFPGPRGIPLLGNVDVFLRREIWFSLADLGRIYGPVTSVSLLGRPALVLNNAQAARGFFDAKSALYSNRPAPKMVELSGFDQGIVLQPDPTLVRPGRRLVHQTLHPKKALLRRDAQEFHFAVLVRNLLQTPDEFMSHIRYFSSGVNIELSHGHRVTTPDDVFMNEADKTIDNFAEASLLDHTVNWLPPLSKLPSCLPGMGFKRTARKYREQYFKLARDGHQMVKDQIARGTARPSLTYSALVESEKGRAPDDVIMFAATQFYTGGADTMSSIITSFVHCMVMHPDVQTRARDEIDKVVGAERLPELADRAELPFVEAVMMEVMRLRPPIDVTYREAAQDDMHEGRFVKKGTLLLVNMWGMLHDEDIYPEPHAFKPDRWLGKPRDPNTHVLDVVFGFGRRICPGQVLGEESLFFSMSRLLALFDFAPARDRNGRLVFPADGMTVGGITCPVPFQCTITPRALRAEEAVAEYFDQRA